HLRPQQRARAPSHAGGQRQQRTGRHRYPGIHARSRAGADGCDDAGDGWLRDHAPYPRQRAVPAAAHHRADRQGHEGRPGEVPGRWRLRLRGQARQHRAAAVAAAHVVAPLNAQVMQGEEDKVNILLVDDQPARLLSYRSVLEELGQNLVCAHSGAEALSCLMDREFALILLDVSMPGMDGFETAEMIHEHPRFESTPIIFVTGVHDTEFDRLKGYKLGAVDYVSIPVVPEILRGKVSVLIELHCKRRDLQIANRSLAEANRALA